ncbi:AT-rich interactive domain-containing protein 2 [Platanthera guangdongensis]|uniref:AT-rich interactive domain-containing protein 2 n=1 Tax=Platanthera guangdongensis TaxID=2320717 RepID=A0ABR2LUM3_9ASPA
MGCCQADFPDLRGKTEAVVVRLLTASIGRVSSLKEDGRIRNTNHTLGNMLMMLKRAATDPCDDRDLDGQEWHGQVLRARKALFIRLDKCAEAEELPFRKRRRRNFQSTSSTMVDRRNRRSKRLVDLEKFGEILCTDPSTRIPIGRHAQADVPDWIGPIGRHAGLEDNLDDSRWLGTSVWPLKRNNTVVDWESIYKGRRDPCGCVFPGSIECVKLHVRNVRRHLKSNLGRAFFDWRFEQMGEEVSRSWTLKDQVKFDEIVRLNPESAGKSFWVEALKYFTNKSKKEIVSYYFNVYVLRWIRRYTRLKSEAADGDDNINDEDSRKGLDYLMSMKDSEADNSKHSNRR